MYNERTHGKVKHEKGKYREEINTERRHIQKAREIQNVWRNDKYEK